MQILTPWITGGAWDSVFYKFPGDAYAAGPWTTPYALRSKNKTLCLFCMRAECFRIGETREGIMKKHTAEHLKDRWE
jgi:hypothetical protein